MLFTCTAADAGGGAAAPARPRRGLRVDIHCHVACPEASRAAQAQQQPGDEPMQLWASEATRAVNRQQAIDAAPKLTSPAIRLQVMDRMGIDVQVISPAPGHYCYWAEPGLGRDLARLTNDRVAAIAATAPDRFATMGTVPLQAPELACAELRRCVAELGMRGVEIGTNVAGEELSAPRLAPFFALAEELGVLVFLHPSGFTEGRRLAEHYFNNVIGNPLDSTVAVSHLIFGGVLDRHPGLKVCVAHGGGFLPFYAGRMDHAHAARSDCRQHIAHPPSTYLKRLHFDTIVFRPESLAHLVQLYGADHVLLGTDYPFDMGEDDPVGLVESTPGLKRSQKDAILGGNAARLLGLKAKRRRRARARP
jgi:aminocarboxymuconate-semialdehyde decarboxylase